MIKIKLFKISQDVNTDYDTYSDAIVCAKNEKEAQGIHPLRSEWDGKIRELDVWCAIEDVKVEYIGKAKKGLKKGVICASFHAG